MNVDLPFTLSLFTQFVLKRVVWG